MPEDDGKLTDAEMKIVNKWLGEKWVRGSLCYVCGQSDWEVESYLAHAPLIRAGLIARLGEKAYPFILVICANCGHTVFINAVAMGISKGAA